MSEIKKFHFNKEGEIVSPTNKRNQEGTAPSPARGTLKTCVRTCDGCYQILVTQWMDTEYGHMWLCEECAKSAWGDPK